MTQPMEVIDTPKIKAGSKRWKIGFEGHALTKAVCTWEIELLELLDTRGNHNNFIWRKDFTSFSEKFILHASNSKLSVLSMR